MIPSNPTNKAPGLIGLFPELLGIGGIQEVSRQTVRALQHISAQGGWSPYFLGLNDASGIHEYSAAANKIAFRGFGRSKPRFVLAALRSAGKHVRVVVAAHPFLALPASWMKR